MRRIETWQLRAQFAAAMSRRYAAEVPAYTALVDVTTEVNRDYVTNHQDVASLGSLERITADRHGAIRVGSPNELSQVADLFAAFGMYRRRALHPYQSSDPSGPRHRRILPTDDGAAHQYDRRHPGSPAVERT